MESSEAETESDDGEEEEEEAEDAVEAQEESDGDMEVKVLCAICQREEDNNPAGEYEEMVTCTTCESTGVVPIGFPMNSGFGVV